MDKFPVIRLTIENMRHNVQVALSEYTMALDEQVQAAVKEACSPEAIHRLVSETAKKAIDETVTNEVKDFFIYGDGQKAIRDIVKATLGKANGDG